MERKPTYEELEQRVKELEKESLKHRKAEDALRESEEKFRSIFHAERDAIMVFDAEMLRFIEANDATLDLYGYTQEEFLKLTPVDISAEPEVTYNIVKKLGALQQIGEVGLFERKHKRNDGTIFSAEISTSTFNIFGRDLYIYFYSGRSKNDLRYRA
ncbi:MAG: PAS domain S-box protein [Deltaproteobacteria bacterium]|nr:PAS domain S-box protein [Deltaproteobacteria bacterium]